MFFIFFVFVEVGKGWQCCKQLVSPLEMVTACLLARTNGIGYTFSNMNDCWRRNLQKHRIFTSDTILSSWVRGAWNSTICHFVVPNSSQKKKTNDDNWYESFSLPSLCCFVFVFVFVYFHELWADLLVFRFFFIFKKPVLDILDALQSAAKSYNPPLATSTTELGLPSSEFKRHQ